KVTNVQITQNEFDKAQERIQPLEKEHARLAELIAGEEDVIERMAEAAAFVVESLAGDERQKAVRHLVDAVPSARTEHRPTLLLVLGRVKEPLVTDALVGAAKLSPQAICRVAALEALARHADPSTAPVAIQALHDDSWTVRSAALALLREAGGKDAIDPLIQALEREDGRLVDEVIA